MPAFPMQAEQAGLFVNDSGGARPALVLIHGFGADHGVWDAIAAPLSARARILAYDLPGHGRSLASGGSGSAKAAARTILADLAQRDIAAAHVAGHSMGGAVATLMAMAEPSRVASLTLLAPGGFGPLINGPLLRRYAAATDAPALRSALADMSGKGAVVADERLQAELAMRARPGQVDRLVAIAAAITRDDRQGVIPYEALDGLAMPVTVLWGTKDPVLPFTQSDALPGHFTRQALPEAGHMLVGEAPGTVRAALLAALAPGDRASV